MSKTNLNQFRRDVEPRSFKSVDEFYSCRGGNKDKTSKRTRENEKRFIDESMEDSAE